MLIAEVPHSFSTSIKVLVRQSLSKKEVKPKVLIFSAHRLFS